METELIIEIIVLLIVVYLAGFKSYLIEKGKSVALKEDLTEITHQVEKVKTDFIKEQDILRMELQRVLSNEISFQNEERTALINFHGLIAEWLYSILEVNLNDFNLGNIDRLRETRRSLASYYAKCGVAKSRVELLVVDEDLVQSSQELYSAALAFHHWSDDKYFMFQQNQENLKRVKEQFIELINRKERDENRERMLANSDEELSNKTTDLFHEYTANRNHEYFKVKPIEKTFSDKLKEYLKK